MTGSATTRLQPFAEAAGVLLGLAESLDTDGLRTVTDSEGWPIATVVHHVASTIPFIVDFAESIAAGSSITWTQDFIDEVNATHLEFFADADCDEAVALLRDNVKEALLRLGALSDERLEKMAPEPLDYFLGAVWSAGDVIDLMLVEHTRNHIESIRATMLNA